MCGFATAALGAALLPASVLGHTQSFGAGADCPKYGHDDHRDVFNMGLGNDCAYMLGGNDEFNGNGDNDYGAGNGGDDLVSGDYGADYVEGMTGTDQTNGGPGGDDSDVLNNDANDLARGGDGNNDFCHVDTAFGFIVDDYDGCEWLVVP